MASIIIKPEWQLSAKEASSESDYLNRRSFLKKAGLFAMSGLSLCYKKNVEGTEDPASFYERRFLKDNFPPKKNSQFNLAAQRATTPVALASSYNNYYEFTTEKEDVWRLAKSFPVHPWSIEVKGLVEKSRRYDLEPLLKPFSLEERIYRFRCVEAWAMTVPWVGIPLGKFLRSLNPLSKVRYVRFVGWYKPDKAPGQRDSSYYNWPYYEALHIDEAMHELSLLAVGMYGRPLNRQNGAPVRLILPWKYGYKSMKGITQIEFWEKQPPTFWNDVAPREYGFYSNVNPEVPHPRWSQQRERVLGRPGKFATLPYNGYGKWVAALYKDIPNRNRIY